MTKRQATHPFTGLTGNIFTFLSTNDNYISSKWHVLPIPLLCTKESHLIHKLFMINNLRETLEFDIEPA